jgi:hypothetical protein
MVNAGIPERMATKVTGAGTDACFPLADLAEYQHAPVAQLDRASAF